MKLTDYVQAQLIEPKQSLFRRWRVLSWGLWALLVKPEQFYVEGADEPIELDTGSGQLRRLFSGLLVAVVGLVQAVLSLLASVFLVGLMLLSPVFVLILHVIARILVWRNLRRRAQLLAKAREGLEPRQ
jgi:hypothetical protein